LSFLLSVVIPCRNEAENLELLLDEVEKTLAGRNYEVIVVDDASTDNTQNLLRRLMIQKNKLRSLRHDQAAGQSCAVRSGVFAAQGDMILTIDGDGQNNPAYLPQLVDALVEAGPNFGIAAGQRLKRTDTKIKQCASRVANRLRQLILHDDTRDSGCGLKAVHADLFRTLPFFDGWHRYLPALALREGYQTVHLDVVDRQRRHGKSNYGIFDRAGRGIVDLAGVWWLGRRRKIIPHILEIEPQSQSDQAQLDQDRKTP